MKTQSQIQSSLSMSYRAYVPEGDYIAEGDKLTPLLDSGAASDKHAYIVTQ